MFNRIDNRRTRTALVGLVLAGGAVVGATGVVDAASDTAPATDVAGLVDVASQTDGDTDTDAETDSVDREARREARQEARQADRTELATLLGLDVEALGEQLHDGSTLADIATAQGVEVSAVVDLLVEQKTERLADAVDAGRLTQAEADEKAAELGEWVQTRVEEGRPERGEGGERGERGPRGEGGHRGEAIQDGDVAPADGEG